MLDIKLLKPSMPWSSNCYILSSGDEAAVIDPSSHYNINEIQGDLKYIILTHGHYDHFIDISEWVKNTEAEVLISSEDSSKLSDPALNCATLFGINTGSYNGNIREINGGDIIHIGGDTIKVIKTPGHTEGSISLLAGDSIFVGDTIFAGGGYGKCCFPGGDFSEIRKSIIKLTGFDENIKVYSGHGAPTTIGEYKKDIFR